MVTVRHKDIKKECKIGFTEARHKKTTQRSMTML